MKQAFQLRRNDMLHRTSRRTRTRILRNTVFYALVLYLAVFYALAPWIGNDALWIAFLTFLFARGFFLYVCSGRLNVERIIGGSKN